MNFFKRFGLSIKCFCFPHPSPSFNCFNCPFLKQQASDDASIFCFASAVDHFRLVKAKRANYKRENLQKVEQVRQVKERVVIPVATSHLYIKNEKRKPWLGKFSVTDLYEGLNGGVHLSVVG